jgi:hypothetical protein
LVSFVHVADLQLNFYVATLLFMAGAAWFAHIQYGPIGWHWPRRGAALLLARGLPLCGRGHAAQASAIGFVQRGTLDQPNSSMLLPSRESGSVDSARVSQRDTPAKWRGALGYYA